jgi:hypothetical protein
MNELNTNNLTTMNPVKINDIYEKINNINLLTINNNTKFDKINYLYNEMIEEEKNDFYEKYKNRDEFNNIQCRSVSEEDLKKNCVILEIKHQIKLIEKK